MLALKILAKEGKSYCHDFRDVTVDGVWVGDLILCTVIHLVIKLHKSLHNMLYLLNVLES